MSTASIHAHISGLRSVVVSVKNYIAIVIQFLSCLSPDLGDLFGVVFVELRLSGLNKIVVFEEQREDVIMSDCGLIFILIEFWVFITLINSFFPIEGGLEKKQIKCKPLCFTVNFGKDFRLNCVKLLMFDHLLPKEMEIQYGSINIWGLGMVLINIEIKTKMCLGDKL